MVKKSNIVIINYGMSNTRSIYNKFSRMGKECLISSNKSDIEKADKLILPGVGHFKDAMQNLHNLDLIDILNGKVLKQKTPLLGICLGVQLFAGRSEEGNCKGLGWIDAEVVKFNISNKLRYKVPHMGWNDVSIVNSNCLDVDMTKDDLFYFVHSYHLKSDDESIVWMKSNYEYEFISAIHKDNIYGTQFHPEKSHDAGFKLLKKFAEL